MKNPRRLWHHPITPLDAAARTRHAPRAVTLAIAGLLAAGGLSQPRTAAAQGLPVLSGQPQALTGASVSAAGSRMTVHQSAPRMVANWQSFSIGAGNTVQFVQPTASAVALNRVLGADPSVIQGALKANGQVFLLNPNGVLFSPTAQVSVGALVASTLSLADDDFMAGRLRLHGDSAQAVVNRGQIMASDDAGAAPGFVALVGARIVNDPGATISAPGGAVLLGAGQTVTLDVGGPVQLQIERGALNAQITNGGALLASGGRILLNAQGADALSRSVINQSGLIDASSLQAGAQGRISLVAQDEGSLLHAGITAANGSEGGRIDVRVGALIDAGQWRAAGSAGAGGAIDIHATRSLEQTAGALADASGATGGGSVRMTAGDSAWLSGRLEARSEGGVGGQVSVTAASLTLAGAQLMADGATGGGRVRAGGGWQGGDADLSNAATTTLTPLARLSANATASGDGGTVVAWSQERTAAAASISARGAGAGRGGKVEVSSHGALAYAALVDVGAPSGAAGAVLLDPKDIVIGEATTLAFETLPLLDPHPSADNRFASGMVRQLANGNYVVASPLDDTMATNAGAVRLYSPSGALLSTLSGSQVGDVVGSGGLTPLTGNSNYVVNSSQWANGANASAGAVTWRSGAETSSALVSSANSLVGSLPNDLVGNGGVFALPGGNFVVSSPSWARPGVGPDVGAASWGDGTGASLLSGPVSAANSLVGSSVGDRVSSSGVTVLTHGNYVVRSPLWTHGFTPSAGAATWGNGAGGVSGEISVSNSLVGQSIGDFQGHAVTPLANGHYVVSTPSYDAGGAVNVGAATWANGFGGGGAVLGVNALTGALPGDNVGTRVTALTNGNYVVASPQATIDGVPQAGAATWRDGTGLLDRAAVVGTTNSIHGTQPGDLVGTGAIALTNGNYVVLSDSWANGALAGAGMATWADGTAATARAVSTSNSLHGTRSGDRVGRSGVLALPSGAYLVFSPSWTDLDAGVAGAGAVTWLPGDRVTGAAISAANSLVGSHTNDLVGSARATLLSNGNYLVRSPDWSTDAARYVGAVTWADGRVGITGRISAANSLIGSNFMDRVGGQVVELTNGNFVIRSTQWTGGAGGVAGAVTWGDGLRGVTGVVSDANSLVGSSGTDMVGQFGVTPLANGNYVVASPSWGNDRGAVTWGNGLGGTTGVVGAANSLVGNISGDALGYDGVFRRNNGDYIVSSSLASRGGLAGVGAVSLGNGRTGLVGALGEGNSIFGSAAGEGIFAGYIAAGSDAVAIASGAGFAGARRLEIVGRAAASMEAATPFTAMAGQSYTVGAAELAALLASSADVTLQASNDITVARRIDVTGAAGALTLQAGRSVLVDESIVTTGDVRLIANDDSGAVVAADRDSGAGAIRMRSSAVIDVGPTATLSAQVRSGNGDPQSAGEISLTTVRAGSLVVNRAFAPATPPPATATPEAAPAGASAAPSFAALRPLAAAEGAPAPAFLKLPLTVLDPLPDPALELTSLDRRE